MVIDFSILQPLMNEMVLTLAIFIFGTIAILAVLYVAMSKLRFPDFIANPIIGLAAIGCLYYWAKHFL